MCVNLSRWEFYFAYCEAAFDSRYLQDYQIVWQRLTEPSQESSAVQTTCSIPGKAQPNNMDMIRDDQVISVYWQLPADAIAMALFAVYCILGGVVVARQPRMLLALVTFILGQATVKV